jgi:FkbM family methyltransferase
LNNFGNVKTINKAVSDQQGKVPLYERSHDGNRVDSDLYSLYDTAFLAKNNILHPGRKLLQLECDTLDNMLLNQKVDVMKIDIEGAEVLALKGAANVLRKVRKIIVEVHGDNLLFVERILREHDFNTHFIDTDMSHIMGSKTHTL